MDQPQKTKAGFIGGGIFSLLLIIIHVIVDAVNYWSSQADFVLWIFQLVLYFIAAMVSTSSQYQNQMNSDEPLLEIVSAGRGAAMIMAVCMWVYIIIRSIALDDPGMFAGISFVLFIGFMILDMILAIVFGTGGGKVIENQHKPASE